MIDDTELQRLTLFRSLNDAARRVIRESAALRTFPPDTVLWQAGGEPRGLFVVIQGEVRVFRGTHGRQHVIHSEGPGGTLGDVALFHGDVYPATAIAARRTTCLILDRDVLLRAIREDPRLAMHLLERIAGRVRLLVDRLDRITTHSVAARVARWILDRPARPDGSISLGTTQAELAEELGTVREVIVRTLRRFREDGVLDAAGRGRYRVLDATALRRIAGGDG